MQKIKIRGVKSKKELQKVFDLLGISFANTAREFFVARWKAENEIKLWHTRVLEVNGEIASIVQIFPKIMFFKNIPVEIAGIGNVATVPWHRKKGFAHMLLKDTHNLLKEKGFSLAILFTSIYPFYEKVGYFSVPLKYHMLDFKGVKAKMPSNIRMFEPSDFPKIQNLYKKCLSRNVGLYRRTKHNWLGQPFYFFKENYSLFLVYEKKGQIEGYVRTLRETKEEIEVAEICYKEPEVFRFLLKGLVYISGTPILRINVPETEEYLIADIPHKSYYSKGMMANILLPDKLNKLTGIKTRDELTQLFKKEGKFFTPDAF